MLLKVYCVFFFCLFKLHTYDCNKPIEGRAVLNKRSIKSKWPISGIMSKFTGKSNKSLKQEKLELGLKWSRIYDDPQFPIERKLNYIFESSNTNEVDNTAVYDFIKIKFVSLGSYKNFENNNGTLTAVTQGSNRIQLKIFGYNGQYFENKMHRPCCIRQANNCTICRENENDIYPMEIAVAQRLSHLKEIQRLVQVWVLLGDSGAGKVLKCFIGAFELIDYNRTLAKYSIKLHRKSYGKNEEKSLELSSFFKAVQIALFDINKKLISNMVYHVNLTTTNIIVVSDNKSSSNRNVTLKLTDFIHGKIFTDAKNTTNYNKVEDLIVQDHGTIGSEICMPGHGVDIIQKETIKKQSTQPEKTVQSIFEEFSKKLDANNFCVENKKIKEFLKRSINIVNRFKFSELESQIYNL